MSIDPKAVVEAMQLEARDQPKYPAPRVLYCAHGVYWIDDAGKRHFQGDRAAHDRLVGKLKEHGK